jgi:hypothetical protein
VINTTGRKIAGRCRKILANRTSFDTSTTFNAGSQPNIVALKKRRWARLKLYLSRLSEESEMDTP